jgi:hypothetical protein
MENLSTTFNLSQSPSYEVINHDNIAGENWALCDNLPEYLTLVLWWVWLLYSSNEYHFLGQNHRFLLESNYSFAHTEYFQVLSLGGPFL